MRTREHQERAAGNFGSGENFCRRWKVFLNVENCGWIEWMGGEKAEEDHRGLVEGECSKYM